MSDFDAIVIGMGAMGSATCYELARRGARVLGLEQFDIPHTRGSSHGFSRMIRLAYYEHPDYVPLLRRAYAKWDELERAGDRKVLHVTGGVYVGARGSELIEGSARSAAEHGLDHALLDASQLHERYPQFRLPENYIGLFEPRAGWLAPEQAICAFAEAALRLGAAVHAHEPVREWSADGTSVTVRTDRGAYRAAQLVLCGGPWAARLIRDLSVSLTVTRQVMFWIWPGEPERFAPDRFGVWAIGHDDGSLHYGFPLAGEGVGLKLAHHARGPAANPDHAARDPLPGDEQGLRDFLRRFMPASADAPLLAQRACLYTNSPDSHFIIDRHPRHPDRVTFACGFSGHGFKFASVIGEIMADLAQTGSTMLPVEFLSFRRFG